MLFYKHNSLAFKVLKLDEKTKKKLPLIGLLLSFGWLGFNVAYIVNLYTHHKPIILKDISLAGGVEFSFPKNATINKTLVKEVNGIIRETSNYKLLVVPYEKAKIVEKYYPNVSYRAFQPALAKNFFQSLIQAFIFSFLAVALSLFLFFRNPIIPALAVLALVSNVIETISVLNMIGFRFSLAALASLFMFLGYSVDTNILLSEKLLANKPYMEALKTGLTTTGTTLTALAIILLFSNNYTIKEMAKVLFVGLLMDLVNTWVQNGSLLMLYLERLNKTRSRKSK